LDEKKRIATGSDFNSKSDMQMKRVLIITYYWPPSGGAGVQRWLKFVKYLRNYGWEPVVYTAGNPEAPALDHSLMKDVPEGIEVIRQLIWEPYTFYRKFVGLKKGDKISAGFLNEKKNPGFAEKIAVWLRGNLFIPDARRFWIKPSVEFLSKYLKQHPVDAIVSTGPPHTTHVIALGIKKKLGLPWLADFRDPWTKIDFYEKLMLTPMADRRHHQLEKAVLSAADKIVTVSWNWAKEFNSLGAANTEVITNGFDPEDFPDINPDKPASFLITHIGSLNKDRNPEFLWRVLGQMAKSDDAFSHLLKIRFIGKTDFSVFESLDRNGLSGFSEKIDYLPHDEALRLSAGSAVLLLLINNTPNSLGIIPGKVFEYLATRRPVLCIGPLAGDSARIVKETNSGPVVGFDDEAGLRSALQELFSQYISGAQQQNNSAIDHYSRKVLTGNIAGLLNQMTTSIATK
jgi:glycosyltransferase involved in cell wall biosynthesis